MDTGIYDKCGMAGAVERQYSSLINSAAEIANHPCRPLPHSKKSIPEPRVKSKIIQFFKNNIGGIFLESHDRDIVNNGKINRNTLK